MMIVRIAMTWAIYHNETKDSDGNMPSLAVSSASKAGICNGGVLT